jgi:hypothetical protein
MIPEEKEGGQGPTGWIDPPRSDFLVIISQGSLWQ